MTGDQIGVYSDSRGDDGVTFTVSAKHYLAPQEHDDAEIRAWVEQRTQYGFSTELTKAALSLLDSPVTGWREETSTFENDPRPWRRWVYEIRGVAVTDESLHRNSPRPERKP